MAPSAGDEPIKEPSRRRRVSVPWGGGAGRGAWGLLPNA